MKNKGKTWLAVLGFVLFAGATPLLTFPAIEEKLDNQAIQMIGDSTLEGAELEWNGRNGYLSVPGNTEPDAAESTAEELETIQGVRNIKIIYDDTRLLETKNEDKEIEKMSGSFTMEWTSDEKSISGKLNEENIAQVENVFGVSGLDTDAGYNLSDKVINSLKSLGKGLFDDLSEGTLSVDGDSIKISGITAEGISIDDLKDKWSGIDDLELDLMLPENDEKTEEEIEEEIEEVQTEIDKLLALDNIEFDFRTTTITEESQAIVERIAEILLSNGDINIEIIGHTDSKGGESLNLDLSKRRAKAVLNMLADLGVDKSRMTYSGMGESEPIASNDTDEGRQQNRRVEIIVKGND